MIIINIIGIVSRNKEEVVPALHLTLTARRKWVTEKVSFPPLVVYWALKYLSTKRDGKRDEISITTKIAYIHHCFSFLRRQQLRITVVYFLFVVYWALKYLSTKRDGKRDEISITTKIAYIHHCFSFLRRQQLRITVVYFLFVVVENGRSTIIIIMINNGIVKWRL